MDDTQISCKGTQIDTKLTIFFLYLRFYFCWFFVLDVYQESEYKENVYCEDSDDSVKGPNFEINFNKKSSSSDSCSSSSRLIARKRVRRDSYISAMQQEPQTQPFANIVTPGQSGCMIENHDQTPSTSKDILQRRMSLSSDSFSSTSEGTSSRSSSVKFIQFQ